MIPKIVVGTVPNRLGPSHKDLTDEELNVYLVDWRTFHHESAELKRFIFDMTFSWLYHTRELNVGYSGDSPRLWWFA